MVIFLLYFLEAYFEDKPMGLTPVDTQLSVDVVPPLTNLSHQSLESDQSRRVNANALGHQLRPSLFDEVFFSITNY